jgi:endo-1,3(4)-beta-glucanase
MTPLIVKLQTLLWHLWLTWIQIGICQNTLGPAYIPRGHHQVAPPEVPKVVRRLRIESFLLQGTTPKPPVPSQIASPEDDLRLGPRNEGTETTEIGTFASSETVSVSTSVATNGTIQILPTLSDKTPHTTGVVFTALETAGRSSIVPFGTSSIPSPTTLLEPTAPASEIPSALPANMVASNIFADPIATSAPPSEIKIRSDHPVPRKGVASTPPIQTNKFYANFFLGDQTAPTYTHPYSLMWAAGRGATGSYGMAVSHVEANQRIFGKQSISGGASYFINPVGIQSLVFSAKELGKDTALTIDSITAFSARVHLQRNSKAAPDISFPLVQGMGYVTALYNGATPVIQTGVYFKTVTKVTKDPKSNVAKFTMHLEDGMTWRVYAYKTKGDELDLQVINNGLAQAKRPFFGVIQVCKDPGNGEAMYDAGAGIYPTTLELSGSAAGAKGTYTFKFKKDGHAEGRLVMYALPHHVDSFDATTKAAINRTRLQTTTKGIAAAVVADEWTMIEPNMPISIAFAPWSPTKGSNNKLSSEAKATIRGIAAKEVSQNMLAQSDLDSMYFSGKVREYAYQTAICAKEILGFGQVWNVVVCHQ